MTKQILIIEDERKIAQWVRTYFEQSGYQADIATTGEAGLTAIQLSPPDLVVLDLNLPDMYGLDVCTQIREQRNPAVANVPIIMLTAQAEEADKLAGLEVGADDYVTKPFSPKELVARASAIFRRIERHNAPKAVLKDGGLLVNISAHRATLFGRKLDLTPNEFNVLVALLQNQGITLSRSQLIEAALGHDYEGQERSIDVYVRYLRRKLETDSGEPCRITTVFGVGYRYE